LTRPRPDILYVVHRVPYPPDKGDRIRSWHILRQLAARANVHLACLADEPVAEETRAALAQHCARVAVIPLGRWSRWLWALQSLVLGGSISEGAFYAPALVRVLRAWAEDTVFCGALASASSVARYLRIGRLCEVQAVVDLMDVDSQKWLDYAAACRPPRSWLYGLEAQRVRRWEMQLARWARAVTLVSDHEAELCRSFVKTTQVCTVPSGVDLEHFQPQPDAAREASCVFVGALDYRPNVDAACWFTREVWPKVRARYPQARLRVVGRRPRPEVEQLASVAGVEVVANVPDVRPYLAEAAVAVAPLRIARGVQNKVLEAMAMARPVVASPEAMAGLGTRPDLPVVRAEHAGVWVEKLDELLADEGKRRLLGQMGRQYVEQHHCWERCVTPLLSLLGIEVQRTEEGASSCPANSVAGRTLVG
jgi:sugar transferase (PEP-CTERM/EpsH1 system associated)